MKRNLIIGIVVSLIIAGTAFFFILRNNTDKDPRCQVVIKDITLTNKTDTISYALGYVWAVNMSRYINLNDITYAFYNGVQNYINKDTALMGINAASEYLEGKQESIKTKKWPVNDSTKRLCDIELETEFDTFSYALGYAWCRGAYGIGISQISPAILNGLYSSFRNDTTMFKDYASANNYLMAYIDELRMQKYGDIKLLNEQWLKENSTKEGILTLSSGLQYKIIKHGKGKMVGENDIIECYYTGKLIDGTVYEYYGNNPYKFYQFATTLGVAEAVKLMREGDKWELYIPYYLAYGSGGINQKVPPFATIIVEIELLKAVAAN